MSLAFTLVQLKFLFNKWEEMIESMFCGQPMGGEKPHFQWPRHHLSENIHGENIDCYY